MAAAVQLKWAEPYKYQITNQYHNYNCKYITPSEVLLIKNVMFFHLIYIINLFLQHTFMRSRC